MSGSNKERNQAEVGSNNWPQSLPLRSEYREVGPCTNFSFWGQVWFHVTQCQNPFGHHCSADVSFVCSPCVPYVKSVCVCGQELFSLALNKNQIKMPSQWLCKISLVFSLI